MNSKERNTTEIISLFISIIAIVISFFAAFEDYLIPFRAEIFHSNTINLRHTIIAPDYELVMHVELLNSGKRVGAIDDIMIFIFDEKKLLI